MTTSGKARSLVLTLLLSCAACTTHAPSSTVSPSCDPRTGACASQAPQTTMVRSRYREGFGYCGAPDHPPCHPEVPVSVRGIGCETLNEPNRPVLPPSYKVDDIGKPGVVLLPGPQAALARRIQHFVRSKTLRFTIIGPLTQPGSFVVFDATQGPCYSGAPGYLILNDTSGLAYYQPGEDPGSTHGIPGDITTPSPGPWCRPRRDVARCY